MKREQVIDLANQAGGGLESNYVNLSALERFAELVAIAEREECAKVCEGEYVDALNTGCSEDFAYNNACDHCAASIRSRGAA